ncbi:hypothetical protein EMPS_02365 [Entomortierella parvispora]|uniref:Uncharacterized protein n=1 Tax=Entomortierella parvispora TaxID=205924 RepID=A0A9P3LTE4_9FUNG|nr:hypothetical protein EMPS_02365 [Entomortierella parvispora]
MADFLPQLIEFATQLDLQRLIVFQTILSLFGGIRTVPSYNIPLLFFGLYAYQHHDSSEPLQQFAGFTAFSILLDIVWCLLSPGIGFGEGLTIAVLLIKPMTIISSLQLLKYRGDPFSSLGGGGSWQGHRGNGLGGISGYQTLGDAMDDERDAEEINIPRHSHNRGRRQHSQQSSSFMTNNSIRSTSSKSSRATSGHNVELGGAHNENLGHAQGNSHGHTHGPGPGPSHGQAPAGVASFSIAGASKDDRKDKVGQNISDEEADEPAHQGEATKAGAEASRSGYQSF